MHSTLQFFLTLFQIPFHWKAPSPNGWLLCLLLAPFACIAQENQPNEVFSEEEHRELRENQASEVFPKERHRELREHLSFQKDDEEVELEEEEFESWWNFEGYENWSIDLSNGATIFILLLLLVGLGYLIFRILGDVETRKRTRGEEEEEQEEINIDDLEEEHLVAEGVSVSFLERAEGAGQYDIAVRLLYIQLLKELQDGGLIQYRRNFSNRDYQQQLRGTAFLEGFREVTADYERFWYGKYPIERLGYRLVYGKFTKLNASIQAATAKPSPYV